MGHTHCKHVAALSVWTELRCRRGVGRRKIEAWSAIVVLEIVWTAVMSVTYHAPDSHIRHEVSASRISIQFLRKKDRTLCGVCFLSWRQGQNYIEDPQAFSVLGDVSANSDRSLLKISVFFANKE